MKAIRGQLIPLAHRNVEHEFRVALDGDEREAVAQVLIVFGTNALFFFAQKSSKLRRTSTSLTAMLRT